MPCVAHSIRFRRVLLACSATVLLTLAQACSSEGGSDAVDTSLGFLVNNGSSLIIEVEVDGPYFDPINRTLNPGTFFSGYQPGFDGNEILIKVSDPSGVYADNAKACRASSVMEAPDGDEPAEYGQADLAEGTAPGAPLGIRCGSGWQNNGDFD